MKTKGSTVTVSRQYAKRGRFAELWHRMSKNPGAVFGLAVIVALILVMIYSFFFISFEEVTAMNPVNRYAPPSAEHPFGMDDMGRDLLLRTLYGTRYSFAVGFGAVAFSIVTGIVLGAISGYFGGWFDEIVMRASDVLASIPALLLGMVIVVVLGKSLPNLTIAVGVAGIPTFMRIARASVITVKNNEYIEAAHAIGMSGFRIIFTQVIPNGLSPIIVIVTTRMGAAIIEASSLSFLGFGVPAPTPEWGALVSAGRNFIRMAPHIALYPGLFIVITVLACSLLGDGLRDALDPKLKR